KSVFTASNNIWVTTSPTGRTLATVINDLGQPVTRQAGKLAPLKYQYDEKGRLSALTRNANNTTRTVGFNYFLSGPASGYLKSITGPMGLAVRYQRDADGRVTQLTRPDGGKIEFSYDAEGRLTKLIP